MKRNRDAVLAIVILMASAILITGLGTFLRPLLTTNYPTRLADPL